MATLATSTTAFIVQPLLRATGACRVLTDADVVALKAELDASLVSVRDALAQTHHVLRRAARSDAALDTLEAMYLPPSALPALSIALSRRRAIFGGYVG